MSIELVIACDPDSKRSALAWAVSRESKAFDFVDVIGGGSGAVVAWQSATGMTHKLNALAEHFVIWPSKITLVCETQAPDGPRSADVEALRRVRYHWEATCEIVGAKYVDVQPMTWERLFLGEEYDVAKSQGPGAIKRAYQKRAKELTLLATNEDRCAAIGMLHWYVESIGSRLVFAAR
jgi:hypothetical protein